MIDIFVPTWTRDLPQTKLLLRTLDRFVDREAVGSLNLAAVDQRGTLPLIHALDTGKFRDRTRCWSLPDLGLREIETGHDGWVLQQAAKLVFARFAGDPFFMVLDSKNLALRPVTLSDLVVNGQAPQVLEPVSLHARWWRGSAWAMAHKRFDRANGRLGLSSATPVVFHTESVVRMLDWLERHHGESIDHFFLRKRAIRDRFMRPTEFTMYYVFMDREGRAERWHFPSDRLHDVDSQVWASQPADVRAERIARIVAGQTTGLFTGIAQPAWAALEAREKKKLTRFAAGP